MHLIPASRLLKKLGLRAARDSDSVSIWDAAAKGISMRGEDRRTGPLFSYVELEGGGSPSAPIRPTTPQTSSWTAGRRRSRRTWPKTSPRPAARASMAGPPLADRRGRPLGARLSRPLRARHAGHPGRWIRRDRRRPGGRPRPRLRPIGCVVRLGRFDEMDEV